MAYKIEKGIPIPRAGDSELEAALKQMEVGDSILVPGKHARNLGLTLGAIGRRIGAKFEAHTVEGGARVWRVAGEYAPAAPRKPRAPRVRVQEPVEPTGELERLFVAPQAAE